MQIVLFAVFSFGKMWKNMVKHQFFQAATAGLGKYRMAGYGQIGVYRDKDINRQCCLAHFVTTP